MNKETLKAVPPPAEANSTSTSTSTTGAESILKATTPTAKPPVEEETKDAPESSKRKRQASEESHSSNDSKSRLNEGADSASYYYNPVLNMSALDGVGMEVDSASSSGDTDSAIGIEIEGSTVSVRESVYRYIEENGRTYHAYNEGKYILPNDEAEQDRLDLQHHLFLLSLDGALHLAPLPERLHNVMDIGTGTGIWATEFAEKYPSASVLGTDLSPIQSIYVPPNCRFEVSDVEEEWSYSQEFDYIHGRALLSCFRDPAFVVSSAFSVLRPGGILELQDPQMPITCIDSTMDGTALGQWSQVVGGAAAKLGRSVTNSKNYGRYMQAAGFVDIVEKHFYWPCNTWPRGQKEKMIGMWTQQNLLDGISAMSMAVLTRGEGWSKEQVEIFLAAVRNDIRNRRIHSYIDVVVFYGRKPE